MNMVDSSRWAPGAESTLAERVISTAAMPLRPWKNAIKQPPKHKTNLSASRIRLCKTPPTGGRLDFLRLAGAAALSRVNRVEFFADDQLQVCHLVNRCVRRTYLCGQDEETCRDYSHRKPWKSLSNAE